MSLIANDTPKTGSKYPTMEALEPGSYPVRLVQVIDLGVQAQRPYQGKTKPDTREIHTTYEILDEYMNDEHGAIDYTKPRWIGEKFGFFPLRVELSKGTKRYLTIDPKAAHKGDWSKLLGKPCMVTVAQNEGKGRHLGRTFNNIAGTSAMRPSEVEAAREAVSSLLYFNTEHPDMTVWESLPNWLQEKIKEGVNFNGSILHGMLGGAVVAATDDDDGDNPF
jgi:hypothetical protein